MSGSLALLAACSFDPYEGAPGDPPGDPPPITCGELSCSGNAVCSPSPAQCVCKSGYAGDGMQCDDVDECAVANDCPAACANTPGAHECYVPRTCADVAAKTPGFAGGDVTLYLGGRVDQPWTAYCHAVGGEYREYLSLADPEANYSQYTAGGKSVGTDVRTKYSKVRIDPMMTRVYIGDRTFATSTGMLVHPDAGGNFDVTSMPYGVAMNCRFNANPTPPGPQPADGTARIDLTGTRFSAIRDYVDAGAEEGSNVSGDDRSFSIVGHGSCGWAGPRGVPPNPFNDRVNDTNGRILRLRYDP